MMKKITALLLVLLLLAGCSAAGDVETLLRAPQLSGESAALQKALNNYLGGSATLKYPASGDFLSPFAFGDWDGDGVDEAESCTRPTPPAPMSGLRCWSRAARAAGVSVRPSRVCPPRWRAFPPPA